MISVFLREQKRYTQEELVKEFAGDMIPIVKTQNIGHAVDSRAIGIGKEINI